MRTSFDLQLIKSLELSMYAKITFCDENFLKCLKIEKKIYLSSTFGVIPYAELMFFTPPRKNFPPFLAKNRCFNPSRPFSAKKGKKRQKNHIEGKCLFFFLYMKILFCPFLSFFACFCLFFPFWPLMLFLLVKLLGNYL